MLAILSDIHGNLPALQAVIADAKLRGCTNFISLGDVAGYGAQPDVCIDILRELEAINILGNHDSYITENERCPRSRVVTQIINYQRSVLKPHHVSWLRDSVRDLWMNSTYFVHGGPQDPKDQYLYKVSKCVVPDGMRWLFTGHTHVQTLADFGDRGYCNPGSVGQPRDGDSRAAYAIMDGNQIVLRRVEYDVDRAVFAMKKAGFEAFCYENLYTGSQIGGRIDKVNIIFE